MYSPKDPSNSLYINLTFNDDLRAFTKHNAWIPVESFEGGAMTLMEAVSFAIDYAGQAYFPQVVFVSHENPTKNSQARLTRYELDYQARLFTSI